MAANILSTGSSGIRPDRGAQQNPVSRRRLARDIAEMVNEPYPNTKLIPSQRSLNEACLILNTGTRFVHVGLLFLQNYPRLLPEMFIDGRPIDLSRGDIGCSSILASDGSEYKQAYTIKTLAVHLLSIFDGETELGLSSDHVERRLQVDWQDSLCERCGLGTRQSGHFDFEYWWTDLDAINLDADESASPRPIGSRGPGEPKAIRDLPVELLNNILGYLDVEDIVRFGQAWDRIANIVEENVVIRDRELQCFVTKEHFTRSPLGIGVSDDEASPFELESEFDLVSLDAFLDLEVCISTYGFVFFDWLPLPLTEKHWEQVKGDALNALARLSQTVYSGVWHSPKSDLMDVLIAFMDNHVLKLFTNVERRPLDGGASRGGEQDYEEATGMLQVSEKGIEGLFSLFHLLLCLAVDNHEYVSKANEMVTSFQTGSTPTQDMPSPGRMLMVLLLSSVKTNNNFMIKAVAETVKRNVPTLLTRHPELLYMEPDGTASAYRLYHTFMGSRASYRTLMFADLFQRTVRPSTNGTTLTQARDALFRRHGFPFSSTLALLVAETRRILAVDSFAGFLEYLGVIQAPSAQLLSAGLRVAVRDSSGWDHTTWALDQDEALVLRCTAEHWSTLPQTEGLPSCPAWPTCREVVAEARALGFYTDCTPWGSQWGRIVVSGF